MSYPTSRQNPTKEIYHDHQLNDHMPKSLHIVAIYIIITFKSHKQIITEQYWQLLNKSFIELNLNVNSVTTSLSFCPYAPI